MPSRRGVPVQSFMGRQNHREAGALRVFTESVAPAEWDSYVDRHPLATAYHRVSAVLVGRKEFGLDVWFLTAEEDGRIVGLLPLVEQSSLLFGCFLVSLPFFTYGGILADNDRVAAALSAAAAALGQTRRVDHIELRHRIPLTGLGMPDRLDKVSLVLSLPASESELGKRLGSKLRSQIRRAEREDPEVIWGGAELIPDFYLVFSRSMRDLGTPVYPRGFFESVCRALEDRVSILVVRVRGQVQAAAIIVRHGKCIEVPWAAATPDAKRNAINMRMYWELLAFSVRAGAELFDFGRSTVHSGTYRFKMQWGAKPMQLYWHYWLPEGHEIPKLNQSNPKYALAASLWSRMPVWCANLIGPMIVRNLP